MLYFPQLSTGASGQFPIQRQRISRTVVNESCENYEVKLADPGAAETFWHLSFDELTDQELAALEVPFQTVEGSLTTFTFVDPTDNLLAWSQQQDHAVWQTDPLLVLSGGVADALGGSSAYRISNPSSATLLLQQSIMAPASLEYCFSLYARSDQSSRVWLLRGGESDARIVGPQWLRLKSAGQLESSADTMTFGVALDPGSAVDLFGMQVDAQGGASVYKPTAEISGVYSNARFANDTLTITTMGPGRHACELDIVNVEHL